MFHFPFLHSVLAGDAQMSSGWRGDHRQTPGKTLWPARQMEQFLLTIRTWNPPTYLKSALPFLLINRKSGDKS